MLRRISSSLSIICILIVFSACSNNGNTKDESIDTNSDINQTESITSVDESQQDHIESNVSAEESVDDINDFNYDRQSYTTELFYKGPSPQDYENESPSEGVSEITYKSGNLELKAWISEAPNDGKKHPAIVYAHGGFAFGESDWDDAKPYLDAGYVLMTPMFRGENGNPGNYELFYGEVNDAIAAGNYLKSLSYVDLDRIFLSGHSTGGTISMLTSLMPSPYKAIASFGGSPEQDIFCNYQPEIVPFDIENQKELIIRSPLYNVESMQKPLLVYLGTEDEFFEYTSTALVNNAEELSKSCELIRIEGDHISSLTPSIEDSIKKFNSMP
ncbi:MAG: hypothetical protein A2Y15_05920 [Clostridiales bacterium GWF2_36_10]|nr:MAG: hypothetical protein A2Y15_05920 [Clostridiales bacterium GWF2_36_10]HAN21606.1 aminopeptidase [Clostridiales bacterium]